MKQWQSYDKKETRETLISNKGILRNLFIKHVNHWYLREKAYQYHHVYDLEGNCDPDYIKQTVGTKNGSKEMLPSIHEKHCLQEQAEQGNMYNCVGIRWMCRFLGEASEKQTLLLLF